MRFQVADAGVLDQICSASGAVREDGKAADSGQRLVFVHPVGKPGLTPHRDRVDCLTAVVEMQCVDAVEELELDAASAQRLVQRRDDDVAHAGRHLPEEGALVLE